MYTNVKASATPEYVLSPSTFLIACKRVLTTSMGFTIKAARDPEVIPERNEHHNTASPANRRMSINSVWVEWRAAVAAVRLCSPEPSLLRGPKEFSLANKGKYTIEKDTSRNMVAAVPLYRPKIPLVRSKSKAKEVALTFGIGLPSVNRKEDISS